MLQSSLINGIYWLNQQDGLASVPVSMVTVDDVCK